MASANLSFYANEQELEELLHWVIDKKQVLFILANGNKKWRAFDRVGFQQVAGRKVVLWHEASGPLPLLEKSGGEYIEHSIPNPRDGWTEMLTGGIPTMPYFGQSSSKIFNMSLAATSPKIPAPRDFSFRLEPAPAGTRVLGRSDFTCPGRTEKASKSAFAFWNQLAKYIYSNAVSVDALGWVSPDKNPTPDSVNGCNDYVAFPGALAEMRQGTPWTPHPVSF